MTVIEMLLGWGGLRWVRVEIKVEQLNKGKIRLDLYCVHALQTIYEE